MQAAPSPPSILTIGETMALVTPAVPAPLEAASDFLLDVAGAESNVASHVAAMGCRAHWVGRLGSDALGRRVRRILGDRGVDTTHAEEDPSAATGVLFKNPGSSVMYYRSESAGSRLGPSALDAVEAIRPDLVHVSGVTAALSESCNALVWDLARRLSGTTTLLSFDVNFRATLWGREVAAVQLRAIAELSDLVFVGLDEARALWDVRTPEDVRELLARPRVLVVKDGDVGATEFCDGDRTFAPAIATDVLEPIGAGDAFAAGYLARYLSGAGPLERLEAGHRRARSVLRTTLDYSVHAQMEGAE